MNARIFPSLLLLTLLATPITRCLGQVATPEAPTLPELNVVVSETMDRRAEGFTTFAEIQSVFTQVLGHQGWPVTVHVDRFASNNPDRDLELRVFFRGIYYETPGQLTVRAWMTLFDHGKEHDFGIVKFQINQGPIEHRDDAFVALLRGEAALAASKIGPILFPATDGHKS